ncbi:MULTISPECIES: MetQ/NlpA family ABC transporter substrate-binding protein [Aeribacillus]|jgi:D-methionine transport system substrate-binding protein|uniref:Lipoprotein n=2 Tax=Aeribacillus TaxID=1055323 RepID=A0A165YQU0_9BACI|nr:MULTISPECIES: MetQ/NlpA family ABC transporter substrate-binding protein [Aeribacillus]KZN97353.1 methionine ABC transporter substrate-binding protein [Aeribacillus pallidus]MDR9797747.1 MetQ/NlpA family ABC transporter substrate-binding protein [Aeribacillus pallidus]MED1440878.1 MetQ/NlpA family ABC transporter substrate-binding protein [Aeribacillus composti]WNF33908.1 MetQ/NlpA family ABC transporter substrate-binding protein [Aeribacillus composti]BBU38536.1 lipoprotein [Aeribacillus p
MKKWLLATVLGATMIFASACGGGSNQGGSSGGSDNEKNEVIKVGASPVPHAEILEEAKPLLEKKGYKLEIEEFTDYVLPNKALAEKDIDANYFQHIPYLEAQKQEHGYDFVNAGGIHIEPIGVYSKKYKSLEELPDGATIIMSNSVADHGRMLSMLEEKGLIKLKDGVDKTKATVDDIAENKKNLKFKTDIEAPMLTKAYENNEGDAVLINGNFALDAGLDPSKDAIALESPKDNPYVNVIAVRSEDKDSEKIKALVEVLQSDEIKEFIQTNYQGSVIPAE